MLDIITKRSNQSLFTRDVLEIPDGQVNIKFDKYLDTNLK